jgi:hypothetical protein
MVIDYSRIKFMVFCWGTSFFCDSLVSFVFNLLYFVLMNLFIFVSIVLYMYCHVLSHVLARRRCNWYRFLFSCCFFFYIYFISFLILIVCAFCIVDFGAGELPGILFLAKIGIVLLRKYCWLQ